MHMKEFSGHSKHCEVRLGSVHLSREGLTGTLAPNKTKHVCYMLVNEFV